MWSFLFLALIAYVVKSALWPHNMWGHSATAVCHLPELITNDVVLVGNLVCPSSSSTHRRDDKRMATHHQALIMLLMLNNTATSSTTARGAKTDPTVTPTPTLIKNTPPYAVVEDFFLFGKLAPVPPLVIPLITTGGTEESTVTMSLSIAADFEHDESAPQSIMSTQV
eukprot:CAMPEP_0198229526 /NCGR_PEP_ID=MMETSP1445-20131203/114170_1 /TAXON_ID=36898 /ORGANISM="Pyramimonas sp., Strain CCMP2087" /LENGTH=167 /DNA_ID=CAMNT_0043909989 /DNA_START=129 /DNA_END=632 /DNA_ORIENTATION=-